MKHIQPLTTQRVPAAAATAVQCGKLAGKSWAYGIDGPGLMMLAAPFLYRYEKEGCAAILG